MPSYPHAKNPKILMSSFRENWNLIQNFRKNNDWTLRYLKTDTQTMRVITKDPIVYTRGLKFSIYNIQSAYLLSFCFKYLTV